MKSHTLVVVAIFLCGLVFQPTKGNDWTGAGTDNLWSNPDNWSQGVVPLNATSHPNFGWDDPDGPFYPLTPDTSDDGPLWNNDAKITADGKTVLIDSTVAATAYGVRIGMNGASNTLEMTGGTLQVGGIPPNQTEVVGWHLDVGRGFNQTANPQPVARLVMTGGVIETNLIKVPEGFVDSSLSDPYDTPGLNGEMIMSGGTITGRKLNVGQFTGNGHVELSGNAVINLWPSVASNRNNAGHFEMKQDWFINGQPVSTVSDASLDIRDDAVINIFGNISELTMTPDQSEVDRMQQYVDDGWLTANNGTAAPVFTLQDCPADGTLDDICLSGQMITITAPAQTQTGDFDGDGEWDCADIDALVGEIVAGTNNVAFDLTGDGIVDEADVNDPTLGWLAIGGANNPAATNGNPFLTGDANLDGSVDVSDFNVWNGNKFSSIPAWCSGDFNTDGSVDVSDFNLWNSSKFMSSGPAVVPEPASGLMLVVGGLLLVRCKSTWRMS